MKIIYGITKSNFGGAQRYVFDLVQAAQKHGHEVKVICGKTGVLTSKLEETGVTYISLPHMWRDVSAVADLKSFFRLFSILRKERPDVFHVNSSKMGGIGGLAARLAGVPKIVFTSHGWEFNGPRPWLERWIIKFFVWITLLLAHEAVCVSKKSGEDVQRWPFVKRKLTVIHNGTTRFNLNQRGSSGLVVGTITELRKIKGVDILLQAWSRFIKHQEATLVIIGEGEEKQNLEDMAKKFGISDSVEFRGFVDNARASLPDFDIFILPSRSENLPYAVLEAGIAGLPVIAARVGGIPEIIETGVSGALVEPENPEALFSTLVLLSEDEGLRKRLGEILKAKVEKEFSLDKMVMETFVIYLR